MYNAAGSEYHRPRLGCECILDEVCVFMSLCACVKGVCQAEDTVLCVSVCTCIPTTKYSCY